jgi:hypothetical protein
LVVLLIASLLAAVGLSHPVGAAEPPLCRGVAPTIGDGSSPGRVIKGTPGDDVIVGDGHQNLILAGKGDDLVCGRGNDDLVAGQAGEDALFGQGGHDVMLGNRGEDRLSGGAGKERLNGGDGFDRCDGGEGQVAFSARTCERHPSSHFGGMRRLYYLGLSFGRYPITLFGARISHNPTTDFGYGHPHGSWPVEIQIWSLCHRYPAAYPTRLPVFSFRGAKAAWNPYGGSLEIYTSRVAIVIFAFSDRLALAAGRKVQDVVEDRRGRLPPPVKGGLDGSVPCPPWGRARGYRGGIDPDTVPAPTKPTDRRTSADGTT